jgi:D-arabinose 1-dehydrogenase-like Zn-dependent alcohol dehydrogenase
VEFSENKNLIMPKMLAPQITRPHGLFEIVEREILQPSAGWVRIKVQACGICGSL